MCVIPAPSDTSRPDGRPYCRCNGLYGGEACASYALPPSTQVFGRDGSAADSRFLVNINTVTVLGDGSNVTTTTRVYNVTMSGTLDIGSNETRALIDPAALAACCNMNGSITVYARLDASASPLADGMLLGQRDATPTLSVYSHFDEGSWRARRPRQEILAVVNPNTLFFVSVFNSRYGSAPLAYDLYLEAVTDGCPPSLGGCSGRGTCTSTGCACDAGYEGLRCEVPVPELASGAVFTVNGILPGAATYWVHTVLDTPNATVEITVNMTRVGSLRAQPILTAAFDSARSTTSVSRLTGAQAAFDYASYRNGNGTQSFVIRRTNAVTQRFLFIGLHNTATARSPLSASVTVTARAFNSLPACTGTDTATGATCRDAHCNGHGNYIALNGAPFCQCDFGWNPDTRCGSPLFASFSRLADSGQRIGFLCSVCEVQNITMEREATVLYKIPQPLQKSTGLRIDVGPQVYARTTRTPRRLIANHADQFSLAVAPSHTAASQGRWLQVGVANATDTALANPDAIGNPSLLVSTTLPRSILDFFFISSSPSENETLAIDTPSPSGQYWVAVYANTPGNFRISAARFSFAVTTPAGDGFGSRLASWLIRSTAGLIVIVSACWGGEPGQEMGMLALLRHHLFLPPARHVTAQGFAGVLMVCVCGGCILQACAGRCCCKGGDAATAGANGKGKDAAGDAELAEMKRAAFIKSVRNLTTSLDTADGGRGSSAPAAVVGDGSKSRVLTAAASRRGIASPGGEAPQSRNLGSALIAAASTRNLKVGASSRNLGGTLRTPSGNHLAAMSNPLLARGDPAAAAAAFAAASAMAAAATGGGSGAQAAPVSPSKGPSPAPSAPPVVAYAGAAPTLPAYGSGSPPGYSAGGAASHGSPSAGGPFPGYPSARPAAGPYPGMLPVPQFSVGGPMMMSPGSARPTFFPGGPGGYPGGGGYPPQGYGHGHHPSAFPGAYGGMPGHHRGGSGPWGSGGGGGGYVVMDPSAMPTAPPPRPAGYPAGGMPTSPHAYGQGGYPAASGGMGGMGGGAPTPGPMQRLGPGGADVVREV